MKGTFFQTLMKRGTFLGLAIATLLGTSATLTSCSGGGEEDDGTGFKITPAQFRSGARGFSLQSNSGWEFWSDSSETSATDFTLPDSDVAAGTVVTYGSMYYSFTGNRSQLYGLMRYTYDPVENKGTLRYSMDTTNLGNIEGVDTAKEVTGMINTIHGNDRFADAVGPDGEAVIPGAGDGDTNPPGDLSTHIAHTTIVFDFNTGTCTWTCGCGHQSQTMDFLIRHK